MVAWATSNCSQGTASEYVITVTVTDPDTDAGDLTFDGSVVGCFGQIDAVVSTITCPNVAPFAGTITVMDPQNNMDQVSFQIGICESSSCTTDPDTCMP